MYLEGNRFRADLLIHAEDDCSGVATTTASWFYFQEQEDCYCMHNNLLTVLRSVNNKITKSVS